MSEMESLKSRHIFCFVKEKEYMKCIACVQPHPPLKNLEERCLFSGVVNLVKLWD